MSALAVAQASLRRLLRDRTALFFLIVLPLVVILIIGAAERGFNTYPVGVVNLAGPSGRGLIAELASMGDLSVKSEPDLAAAATAVRRGTVDVAVVVPAGIGATLRRGGSVDVPLMDEPASTDQQAASTAVRSAIADYGGRVQAAQFTTSRVGGAYGANYALAAAMQRSHPGIEVRQLSADTSQQVLPQGYSYSAPTMLVLFVFLNAMAGAALIVENKRLGMYQRAMAAPIRTWTVIGGEAAALLVIALGQSLLIVSVGAVVFGVSWGDPLASAVLVALWALVGAGAGMLAGTVFRTPEQASAIAPTVGIAFAMLGGCMWPLAIVGAPMRLVGHFTPQAWAVDAWTALLSRHGTLATIAPQLLVLLAFGAGFLVLASVRLRRSLLRG